MLRLVFFAFVLFTASDAAAQEIEKDQYFTIKSKIPFAFSSRQASRLRNASADAIDKMIASKRAAYAVEGLAVRTTSKPRQGVVACEIIKQAKVIATGFVLASDLVSNKVAEATESDIRPLFLRRAFAVYSFEKETVLVKPGTGRTFVYGQRMSASSVAEFHNSPLLTPRGKVGQAVRINGKDSFLSVDGLADDTLAISQFTIAMWIKSDAGDHPRFLFDLRDGTSAQPKPSMVRLFINKEQVCFGAAGVELRVPADVHTGEWVHVAATWDEDARRIYINGKLAGEKKGDFAILPAKDLNLAKPRLGAQSTGFRGPKPKQEYRTFRGDIDEVLIAVTALPRETIEKIYQKGVAGEPLVVPQ